MVSVVFDKLQSTLDKIKDKTKEVMTSMMDTMSKLGQKIAAKGKEVLNTIGNFVLGLKDGFFKFLEGCKNFVVGLFNGLFTIISVLVNTIVQAGIGILSVARYLIGIPFGISPKDNVFSNWIEESMSSVTGFFRDLSPNKKVYDSVQWVADIALSCIPIVGDEREVIEVITGVEMVTGEELSPLQRGLTIVCMLLPFVGGKLGRELICEDVQFVAKY